jgi:hypothetical protein
MLTEVRLDRNDRTDSHALACFPRYIHERLGKAIDGLDFPRVPYG